MITAAFGRAWRQAVRGSAFAIVSSLLLGTAGSAATQGRVTFPGTAFAGRASSQAVGSVAATEQIPVAITLPLRNQPALDDLLKGLYDPHDPRYHQFLKPDQFAAQFGPTQADYDQVIAFAESQGLTVTGTFSNRAVLDVSGPASAVQTAFGVKLGKFQAADGRVFHAVDRDISVPAGIGHIISGVVGLDTSQTLRSHAHPVSASALTPFDTGIIPNGPSALLTPAAARTAFNIPSVTSPGSGQVLGLFELDGYLSSDISLFESHYGITSPPTMMNVLVDGGSGALGGGQAEVTLDIDMMLIMAPNASKIVVYEAPNSSTGVVDCYNKIATDNTAQEISTSWGLYELSSFGQFVQSSENTAFQQMAAQGQSMFAASGDAGAYDDTSTLSVDDPASQPWMVGVGGTDIFLNSNGTWQSETAWGDSSDTQSNRPKGQGGGGGISAVWTIPTYQQGFITGANSTSMTMRNVPDVSLYGDYDTGGYVVYLNGSPAGFNGTSAAAPLWAGFMALVNQARIAHGNSVIGFPLPILYALAGSSSYTSDFRDPNSLTNLFYTAATGYDLATGIGTINGVNLLADLVPPGAPVLSVQSATSTAITLSWPIVTKAVTYNVYRSTTAGTTGLTKIASNVTTLSFADATAASGTTYYYCVTAVDIAGESALSNQVSASLTNPVPSISSLSPSTAAAGGASFPLTINGANFMASSTVKFGSDTLTPTSITATAITVTVPAADIVANGPVTVSVVNPTPGGGTATAQFTVTGGIALSGFTISSAAPVGGASITGTLTLVSAAPTGGQAVAVTSNNAAVTISSPVTVPANATSTTFTINTTAVAADTPVTLTAVSGGVTKTASLTVKAPVLTAVLAVPNPVVGGNPYAIQARISSAAPTGGITVPVTSNSTAAAVGSVTIPAGATSATVTFATAGVNASTTVTLTGTLKSVSKTATLTVNPAALSQLVVPSYAYGGTAAYLTVYINGKTGTNGATVSLSSSDGKTIPAGATVKIQANANSATYTFYPAPTATDTPVSITATLGAVTLTGSVLIKAPVVSIFQASPTSVVGGQNVQIIVRLTGPAPTGGTVVALSSTSSAVPASSVTLTVPAGSANGSCVVTTTGVDSSTPVTLTGTTGSVSKTAAMTVVPAALSAMNVPASVYGGTTTYLSLYLNGRAGPSGVKVNLSSSDGTTIPAGTTFTIPAGANYGQAAVSPAVVTSDKTITVTATQGSATRSGNLQIKAAVLLQLSSNVSTVTSGQSVTLQARLTSPAPTGGLTVHLSSSNTSVIPVSSVSFVIAAGATSGTVSVPVGTVDVSTSVTLTGTTGSVSMLVSFTVTPAVLSTLSVPASVKGGTATGIAVFLTGKAGPSGVTVTLSSSDGTTIPAGTLLKVPSGASSASYSFTPGTVTSDTSVTITATEGSVTKTGVLLVKA